MLSLSYTYGITEMWDLPFKNLKVGPFLNMVIGMSYISHNVKQVLGRVEKRRVHMRGGVFWGAILFNLFLFKLLQFRTHLSP